MAARTALVLGASGHPEQLQAADSLAGVAAAAVAMASATVDLGYPVRRAGTFAITGLAGLTVGKPVSIWLARGPYSGKGAAAGEEGMYAGQVTAQVTAADTISGSFAFNCRIGGAIKFNYLVGA